MQIELNFAVHILGRCRRFLCFLFLYTSIFKDLRLYLSPVGTRFLLFLSPFPTSIRSKLLESVTPTPVLAQQLYYDTRFLKRIGNDHLDMT